MAIAGLAERRYRNFFALNFGFFVRAFFLFVCFFHQLSAVIFKYNLFAQGVSKSFVRMDNLGSPGEFL